MFYKGNKNLKITVQPFKIYLHKYDICNKQEITAIRKYIIVILEKNYHLNDTFKLR